MGTRAVALISALAIASGLRVISRNGHTTKSVACAAHGLAPADITNANYNEALKTAAGTALIGTWYGNAYGEECLAIAHGAVAVLPACDYTPVLCGDAPVYGVSQSTVTVGPFVTATETAGPLSTATATRTTTIVAQSTRTVPEKHTPTYPPLPPGSVITANRRYAVVAELAPFRESAELCGRYGLHWAFVDDLETCGLEAYRNFVPLFIQPRFPTAPEAMVGAFVCPAVGKNCTIDAAIVMSKPWFPNGYAVCQRINASGQRVLTAISGSSGFMPADVDAACAARGAGSIGYFPADMVGAPIQNMPLNVYQGQTAWVKMTTPTTPLCGIFLGTPTWTSLQFMYDEAQCGGTVPAVCALPPDYPY